MPQIEMEAMFFMTDGRIAVGCWSKDGRADQRCGKRRGMGRGGRGGGKAEASAASTKGQQQLKVGSLRLRGGTSSLVLWCVGMLVGWWM